MDLSDEVARKYGKKICDFLGVKVSNSTGMVQTPSGLKTVRGICRAIENILDEARMEEVKMDSDGYNTGEDNLIEEENFLKIIEEESFLKKDDKF